MLTFRGTSTNINKPLIGRVSFSLVEKEDRHKTIIINPTAFIRDLNEYVALLFTNSFNQKSEQIPMIHDVDCVSLLNQGDVIEILPNGIINIQEENKTESNLRLISLIDKNTKELAFNGGEPTLVGTDLFRLIFACKHFLPTTSLLLLTNARGFKDFEYTHVFSSLCHPDLTISTSLYGDNEIEHDYIVGSKGAFNEAILGMLNLATFGHPIEIRIVIHKYTYENLLGIAEYIYKNLTFVGHIAFMGMETIWQAKKNFGRLWVEPNDFVFILKEAIHHLRQRGMNVSIYNIPLCLLPRDLWQFARRSITDWKNAFDADCIQGCSVKDQCSGMFNSGVKIYKQYIKPIS